MERQFQIIDGRAVRTAIAVTEYDLLDYYSSARRRRDAREWTVVDDLPDVMPIDAQLLDILEIWFGNILDDLLAEGSSREHGDDAHGK